MVTRVEIRRRESHIYICICINTGIGVRGIMTIGLGERSIDLFFNQKRSSIYVGHTTDTAREFRKTSTNKMLFCFQ